MKILLAIFLLMAAAAYAQNQGIMQQGTQSVYGVKSFTNNNLRVSLTPALSNEAASKAYVDGATGSAITSGAPVTIFGSGAAATNKFLQADGSGGVFFGGVPATLITNGSPYTSLVGYPYLATVGVIGATNANVSGYVNTNSWPFSGSFDITGLASQSWVYANTDTNGAAAAVSNAVVLGRGDLSYSNSVDYTSSLDSRYIIAASFADYIDYPNRQLLGTNLAANLDWKDHRGVRDGSGNFLMTGFTINGLTVGQGSNITIAAGGGITTNDVNGLIGANSINGMGLGGSNITIAAGAGSGQSNNVVELLYTNLPAGTVSVSWVPPTGYRLMTFELVNWVTTNNNVTTAVSLGLQVNGRVAAGPYWVQRLSSIGAAAGAAVESAGAVAYALLGTCSGALPNTGTRTALDAVMNRATFSIIDPDSTNAHAWISQSYSSSQTNTTAQRLYYIGAGYSRAEPITNLTVAPLIATFGDTILTQATIRITGEKLP